ncbi:hypothetical protein H632_c1347p1 [Helicosporidium sp. ATCC 50920]|nr:hypothetical protein H632_c1347p1 [Helicosporidium sp. ATCC 50920]|eukprot:KDD74390.1 hypothetical protein H632_c1347p1 [Helicosporidium sp. ATCC 50920]
MKIRLLFVGKYARIAPAGAVPPSGELVPESEKQPGIFSMLSLLGGIFRSKVPSADSHPPNMQSRAGPTPAEARTQSALAARDAHWIARAEDNRKGATMEESVVELEATAAAASMARCGRPRCGRALEADDDAGSSCIPLGLDSFRLFARLSCPELRLEPQIMQALLEIYLSYDRRPSAKELLWRLHDCGRMQAAGKTLPLFDEVSTAAIEA